MTIKHGFNSEVQEVRQLLRNLHGRKGTCKRRTTTDGETSARKKVKAWAVVGPAACRRCYLYEVIDVDPMVVTIYPRASEIRGNVTEHSRYSLYWVTKFARKW